MRTKVATEVGIMPIAERIALRLGNRDSYMLIELSEVEAAELRDNLGAAVAALAVTGGVAPDFQTFLRSLPIA